MVSKDNLQFEMVFFFDLKDCKGSEGQTSGKMATENQKPYICGGLRASARGCSPSAGRGLVVVASNQIGGGGNLYGCGSVNCCEQNM